VIATVGTVLSIWTVSDSPATLALPSRSAAAPAASSTVKLAELVTLNV
jgi:hypothetical protein